LVAGWLALADPIPLPGEARTGIFRDIYDLIAGVGATSAAAAAVFAAYVLGILSVRATAVLRAVPTKIIERRRRRANPERVSLGHSDLAQPPSHKGREALREAVLQQLEKRSEGPELGALLAETAEICGIPAFTEPAVRRKLLNFRLDIKSYQEDLEKDLQNMPLRLLGDDKERGIYGEYDRRRAEGEFREALVIPLAALVVVVAARTSPWALLALVLPAILLNEARRNFVDAADVLAGAIRAGNAQISSPALDDIRAGALRQRENWLAYAAASFEVGAMEKYAAERMAAGDRVTAKEWYEGAAEQGSGSAMMWLAETLHRGGSASDASKWYTAAAKAGEPRAVEIARWRERGMSTIELDDLKSAYAGDGAAKAAAAEAMLRLSPTQEEIIEAEEWLNDASKAGDHQATTAYVARLTARGETNAARAVEQRMATVSPD
jgi:hypothetical protein